MKTSNGAENMTLIARAARVLVLGTAAAWGAALVFLPAALAHPAAANDSSKVGPTLMQQMVGTWDVQQRMWPGPAAEPNHLPPAIARRRLIGGAFLEEVMEPAKRPGKGDFTRTAYFNYNAVSQRYEYFSLDTRAPQMMNERSEKTEAQGDNPQGEIKLEGGTFVAAQWGPATNVAFVYRLTVGRVRDDQQVVQLYLTPQSEKGAKEFLAFEYVYTRQPRRSPQP
jgi:Protein of unknown function (DUF1579)